MAGYDGVAQRNSVSTMTGKKQAAFILLQACHELLEPTVSNIVLRDGSWIKTCALECWLSSYVQDNPQVFYD